MEIRLSVESSAPSGLLHHGTEPPLPFAGWLELLRALSLVVGDGGADPAPHDPSGTPRTSADPTLASARLS